MLLLTPPIYIKALRLANKQSIFHINKYHINLYLSLQELVFVYILVSLLHEIFLQKMSVIY